MHSGKYQLLRQEETKLNCEELIQFLGRGNRQLTEEILGLVRCNQKFQEVIEEYLMVTAASEHWTAKKGPHCTEANQYRALMDDRMDELHTILRQSGISITQQKGI